MILRDQKGRTLLITKSFYPKGIYRLPGGGIEKGETPEEALRREAKEEFNREIKILKAFGTVECQLQDNAKSLIFTSYPFLIETQTPVDLKEDTEHSNHKWIEPKELKEYIAAYSKLPGPEGKMDWSAWGRFRVVVLKHVYENLNTTLSP